MGTSGEKKTETVHQTIYRRPCYSELSVLDVLKSFYLTLNVHSVFFYTNSSTVLIKDTLQRYLIFNMKVNSGLNSYVSLCLCFKDPSSLQYVELLKWVLTMR